MATEHLEVIVSALHEASRSVSEFERPTQLDDALSTVVLRRLIRQKSRSARALEQLVSDTDAGLPAAKEEADAPEQILALGGLPATSMGGPLRYRWLTDVKVQPAGEQTGAPMTLGRLNPRVRCSQQAVCGHPRAWKGRMASSGNAHAG